MKLSFWGKFGVLMLTLFDDQCASWMIEIRSRLGFGTGSAVADVGAPTIPANGSVDGTPAMKTAS